MIIIHASDDRKKESPTLRECSCTSTMKEVERAKERGCINLRVTSQHNNVVSPVVTSNQGGVPSADWSDVD